MSSTWGRTIRISIFGQSHSPAIGVVIDGLPAGISIDQEKLQAFLARRAPGSNSLSTPRKEADKVEWVSGLINNVTCGSPLCALIENTNTRSNDYDELKHTPRPGHADFTAQIKHQGFQDARGGGHFSGRLTAPLCIAGGICLQILEQYDIHLAAHIASLGGIEDARFDPINVSLHDFSNLSHDPLTTIDATLGKSMATAIENIKQAGDSLGGTIECAAVGLPAGLGDPMFNGLENTLSQALFAIPGIKGIEFGRGFESAQLTGSENNDPFVLQGESIRPATNNHGGILGGISSGMPLIFRVAVKPTPSIALPQQSVNLIGREERELSVHGRHDPCIVPRAVPCIEAATALVLLDMLYSRPHSQRP